MGSENEWEEKVKRLFDKSDAGKGTVQTYRKNNSTLLFCPIWDGVLLWSNEIRDKYIPFSLEMKGNYITFNYCAEGRCEIEFPIGNRYIYMKKGMISLNQIQPIDGYYYPGKKYDGLELAFDLDVLSDDFPDVLSEYGLTKGYLLELIDRNNSLLLASVNQKIQLEANKLIDYLKSRDVSIEKIRYEVLRMFFLLKEEGLNSDVIFSVSKGQRQIANEIEEKLTADLSVHHVISEMAKDYGISASALKKYFVQV